MPTPGNKNKATELLRNLFSFVLLTLSLLRVPALAEQPRPTYLQAEKAFSGLSVEQRIKLQVLLTASGNLQAVPQENYGKRLHDAICRFQAENGFAPTGLLNEQQIERLLEATAPLFERWGIRKIAHPERGRPIWVPVGLGLKAERTRSGLAFKDDGERVRLNYNYFPNTGLKAAYDYQVDKLTREGAAINYKAIRPDFFAISSTSAAGVDGYIRYHQDGTGLLGFSMYWNNSKGNVSAERVAVLASGALASAMAGTSFADPPTFQQRVATPRSPPPSPSIPASRPTEPDEPLAPQPRSADRTTSTGTGVFITKSGHVLTNAHVVEDCSRIEVKSDFGSRLRAAVVARDPTNDLALLKTSATPAGVAGLRTGIRLGEPVAAFGFPLAPVLSSFGNFTRGDVTALSGLGDDSRYLQISTPVQPGNSGGPLLDQSGNFVGVVSAKLNALRMMLATRGDIPQNVNFAIRASVVASFLESSRVSYERGTVTTQMTAPDLADHARSMSVFITCE